MKKNSYWSGTRREWFVVTEHGTHNGKEKESEVQRRKRRSVRSRGATELVTAYQPKITMCLRMMSSWTEAIRAGWWCARWVRRGGRVSDKKRWMLKRENWSTGERLDFGGFLEYLSFCFVFGFEAVLCCAKRNDSGCWFGEVNRRNRATVMECVNMTRGWVAVDGTGAS